MKHPLHILITEFIENNLTDLWSSKVRLIKDQACGGKQQIPLFLNETKSRKTELCKVDLAIVKDNYIEALVEIDTKIIPTQICGKFLTSALSSFYIHRTEIKPIPLSNNVLFVQILDSEFRGLVQKDLSAKIEQGKNIEMAIQGLTEKMNLNIKEYKLFWATKDNFNGIENLIEILRKKLR